MEKSNLKKYGYSIAILDKTEQKICYQKNNSVAMILEDININSLKSELFDKNINQNTIIFSNFDKNELWLSGLLSNFNIKHALYLNTPFANIKNNFFDNEKPDNYLYKMFFFFDKIINLAIHYFDIDIKISELSLAISYACSNKQKNNFVLPPNNISDCLMKTYQDEIVCLSERELQTYYKNNYKMLTIKKNGVLYSEELLNNAFNSIPNINSYVILTKKDIDIFLNSDADSTIQSKSFLLKIKTNTRQIKEKYKRFAHILENNLYTHDLTRRIERTYINHIEYRYLKDFFDFEIVEIILFDSNIERQDINKKFFLHNDFLDSVFSNGLTYFSSIMTILVENYILALQEKQIIDKKVYVSEFVSVLSSLDKKELIIISMMLQSIGEECVVYSYGRNKINILFNENNDKHKLFEKLYVIINKYGYCIF